MSDEEIYSSEPEPEDKHAAQLKRRILMLRPKYYAAREFIDDVNIFFNKCSLLPRLDWQSFVKIFDEMNLDTILCGRKVFTDTLDFTEETISVMKGFFVKPYIDYQERLAALFLLYTLCRFQPVDCFAFAWFTPRDKAHLQKFTHEARSRRDLEALYCLGSMHARGLIRYTAASQEYGLTNAVIHSNSEYVNRTKAELIDSNPMSNDEVKDIVELCADVKEYCSVKRQVTTHSLRDGERETLMYVDEDATKQLCEDLLNLQCRTLFSSGPQPETPGQGSAASRAEIMEKRKRKAMASPVKPVRHLVSLGDSDSPTKSSRRKKRQVQLKNTENKSLKKGRKQGKRKQSHLIEDEGIKKLECVQALATEFSEQIKRTGLPVLDMNPAISEETFVEMGSANLPLEEILKIDGEAESDESRAPLEAQFCEDIIPTPSPVSSSGSTCPNEIII